MVWIGWAACCPCTSDIYLPHISLGKTGYSPQVLTGEIAPDTLMTLPPEELASDAKKARGLFLAVAVF